MNDWKKILHDIYTPEIGSIWGAPNGIWINSFASNKSDSNYHPSIVGKVSSCKSIFHLVPGTSKDYRKGSCVYKVKLNKSVASCPFSYFLIDLWMSYSKSELKKLKRGWNGINDLSNDQLKDFKLQIKFCNGIDV